MFNIRILTGFGLMGWMMIASRAIAVQPPDVVVSDSSGNTAAVNNRNCVASTRS